ncbi:hypothetical protein EJB05_31202 [Eragrostis curvula]|uniref:EXPERA domain-containing protein n=1 Tax=Eragrostis curvula TaxID=38414 RepID=A0A5J9UEK6_9POAL|nr:hypothetical protein EJB05_31202 [Eragrostis curvula]
MDEKVVIIEVPAPLDMEKKTAASVKEISKFPLPVKSSSSNQKKPGFRMPLLSVRVVLGWAFLNALAVALTLGTIAVIVNANITIPSSIKASKFFQGPELTPAQTADVDFLWEAYLWSTLPEGVAATVGLLLPRRYARGRWSLAFLAIVSVTVAHCMNARAVSVYIAADTGGISWGTILLGCAAVVYLVLDLLGLLSLLIGGPEKIE